MSATRSLDAAITKTVALCVFDTVVYNGRHASMYGYRLSC